MRRLQIDVDFNQQKSVKYHQKTFIFAHVPNHNQLVLG
jgi:hypothetical protein